MVMGLFYRLYFNVRKINMNHSWEGKAAKSIHCNWNLAGDCINVENHMVNIAVEAEMYWGELTVKSNGWIDYIISYLPPQGNF